MVLARPPGWGKSLLQNMLAVYYDRNTSADEFHELFGDLDIGKRPRPKARSFYVLSINLNVENCEPDARYQHLLAKINASVDDFAARYDLPNTKQDPKFVTSSIDSICRAAKWREGRLIVLVDDYDSLVNEMTLDDPDASRDAESIIEAKWLVKMLFYELDSQKPELALITGVNNLFVREWNGASIVEYSPFDEPLASIVGFTERDVRRGLAELRLSQASADSAVELLSTCFGGYRYPGAPSAQPFNAQQCLHFFQRRIAASAREQRLERLLGVGLDRRRR